MASAASHSSHPAATVAMLARWSVSRAGIFDPVSLKFKLTSAPQGAT